jgi:hypothetical protein
MKRHLLPLIAALLPVVAHADPDWRIAVRGGATIDEDEGVEAIDSGRLAGGGEVMLDYRLFGNLWLGVGWGARGRSGHAYGDVQTTLDAQSLRLAATWRQPVEPWLIAFARVGPAAWRTSLRVEPASGRALDDGGWEPGAHAGLGIDVFPLHPAVTGRLAGDLALGLSLEATYDRVWPRTFADEGTRLGDLDLSGPGFLVGLVSQF